jgi:Zn-dependent alcohol dehydrogenase
MKIKAAVCYAFNKPLVVEELDLADPREGEICVKVAGTGICATDLGCIRDGLGGLDQLPMVFGHEGAGIVEQVGPGVTEFNVGDHVILSYPYCDKCEYCMNGFRGSVPI